MQTHMMVRSAGHNMQTQMMVRSAGHNMQTHMMVRSACVQGKCLTMNSSASFPLLPLPVILRTRMRDTQRTMLEFAPRPSGLRAPAQAAAGALLSRTCTSAGAPRGDAHVCAHGNS